MCKVNFFATKVCGTATLLYISTMNNAQHTTAMNIHDAKFKKQTSGEYRIEGTYNGRKVAIEASRAENGLFNHRTYVDGHYVGGSKHPRWTLGYYKLVARLRPQEFFENI